MSSLANHLTKPNVSSAPSSGDASPLASSQKIIRRASKVVTGCPDPRVPAQLKGEMRKPMRMSKEELTVRYFEVGIGPTEEQYASFQALEKKWLQVVGISPLTAKELAELGCDPEKYGH